MTLVCLSIFLDNEHLHQSRRDRLSKNMVSFGPENKKLIKKLLFKFQVKLKTFSTRCRSKFLNLGNLGLFLAFFCLYKNVYSKRILLQEDIGGPGEGHVMN